MHDVAARRAPLISSGFPRSSMRSRTAGRFPAAWYSDAGVAALERERIFARAGSTRGPARAGRRRPARSWRPQAGHIPVVVTRGRDGVLRGFVNVCRHRGHLVAEGSGCRETLQCPYHAWTYGLDGSLRKAPRSEREPGFDPAASPSSPSRSTPGARSSSSTPTPTPRRSPRRSATCPRRREERVDLERSASTRTTSGRSRRNWKVALENYLECYHCPVAHPGFSKVIDVDPDAYGLVVVADVLEPDRADPAVGARRPRQRAVRPARRGDASRSTTSSFPNTTINIAPGPQNLSIERWVPVGPGTHDRGDRLLLRPGRERRASRSSSSSTARSAEEDVALVALGAARARLGQVPQGRLMRESEKLIADFQRRRSRRRGLSYTPAAHASVPGAFAIVLAGGEGKRLAP